MKKLFRILSLMCILFSIGCCVKSQPVRHSESNLTLIEIIKSETVALMITDNEGDVIPFCSGVWISKNQILTAEHCISGLLDESFLISEERPSEKMVADLVINYSVESDARGVWVDPKIVRGTRVEKLDHSHDLALLKVSNELETPSHSCVTLVSTLPVISTKLHVIGHPSGVSWSYTPVFVSQYRNEIRFKIGKNFGPFIQVSGPIWKGNSGGGMFTDNGELVGIASFLGPSPNQSYFIHVESIRKFLSK